MCLVAAQFSRHGDPRCGILSASPASSASGTQLLFPGLPTAMIIAGIDEAGYGPVLGPLVVSAAAFRTAPGDGADLNSEAPEQLWRQLRRAVRRQGSVRDGKLIITDSKLVRRLTDGLAQMERTVLTVCRLLDPPMADTGNIRQLLVLLQTPLEYHPNQCWYRDTCAALPLFCSADAVGVTVNLLRGVLAEAQTAPAALWTELLDEARFNQLLAATRNKATVLTILTMRHLARLHERFGAEPLLVVVDKQGGRDRYLPLLLDAFGPAHFKILAEGPHESAYHIHDGPRETTVFFREKAELSSLPTALASMASKYIREAFMDAFNRWWGQRVAQLRPTAGYYQDAQRWLADTQPHWPALGVRNDDLVRIK